MATSDMVEITVEELSGDMDQDSTYLTIAKEDVPGQPEDGGTVSARLVTIFPGLTFLAIAQAGGDQDLTVEELQGDPDEDSVYIVTPKELIDVAPGTVLSAAVYSTLNGDVLLIEVPDRSAGSVPPAAASVEGAVAGTSAETGSTDSGDETVTTAAA